MKWLLLMMLAAAFPAFANNDVQDYIAGLQNASHKCESMASEITLSRHLADMLQKQQEWNYGTPRTGPDFASAQNSVNQLDACKKDAQVNGSAIYKKYLSKIKTAKISDDAKSVFIAWLANLHNVHIHASMDDELKKTDEQTVLNEAESELQADALTQ